MGVLVIKLTLEEGRYSSPRAEFIDLSAGELRDACVGLGTAHNPALVPAVLGLL
jgi:hypothetical protein